MQQKSQTWQQKLSISVKAAFSDTKAALCLVMVRAWMHQCIVSHVVCPKFCNQGKAQYSIDVSDNVLFYVTFY